MATLTAIPSNYTSMSNLTANSTYPITRAYTDSASTTYTQLNVSKNKTGTVYFTGFDFSSIPSGATITSVVIKVRAMVSSTSYITAATVQASKGTTLVGSSTNYRTTTNTLYTLTSGSWSRADLDNLRIYFSATKSNTNSTAYMRIYGMDVTVTYEEPTSQLYLKENGAWVTYSKVYRKENGAWVEKSADSILSTTANYMKG